MFKIAIFLACTGFAGMAGASVYYPEFPDYSASPSDRVFGTLAPATQYTWTGNLSGTCTASDDFSEPDGYGGSFYFSSCTAFGGDVTDAFSFNAPDGASSATLTLTGVRTDFVSSFVSVSVDGTGVLDSFFALNSTSPLSVLNAGGSGPSTFAISMSEISYLGYPTSFSVTGDPFDIGWTLTVQTNRPEVDEPKTPTVPLPAGGLLLLTGLTALSLRRRR